MRTTGSPAVLEYRRRLAIERINDGYCTQEVADFLGVDENEWARGGSIGTGTWCCRT